MTAADKIIVELSQTVGELTGIVGTLKDSVDLLRESTSKDLEDHEEYFHKEKPTSPPGTVKLSPKTMEILFKAVVFIFIASEVGGKELIKKIMGF